MPQISEREFEHVPLRAHRFLAGVPLHDVWAVDLPSPRDGITLNEFLRASNERLFTPTPVVRGLVKLRLLIGRLLGWDRPRPSNPAASTFADRLTDADRGRSLEPAGVREGPFRVVYRFENEKLVEVINRTVHAAALSALVETANGYRFYFAVYVRSVGRWTPFYMAAIDPFRRLIVYPVAAAQRACELGPDARSPRHPGSRAWWRRGRVTPLRPSRKPAARVRSCRNSSLETALREETRGPRDAL